MNKEKKIRLAIWGTGGQAGSTINYNEVWLKNVDIVCFVSNSHKEGEWEEFYGKAVISPDEIFAYSWDYILILSSYIEDITKQIVNDLKIEYGRIITLEQLAEQVVKFSGLSIIGKRILLYGKEYEDYPYVYHLSQRVRTLKIISDGSNELTAGVEVLDIDNIKNEEYDYLLLIDRNEEDEKKYIDNINKANNTNVQCVLRLEEWIGNLAFEYHRIIDSNNPVYYSIVPRPHHGLMGLFTEYLRNCDYAYSKGYLPFVDMQNSANIYLDDSNLGKQNAWEYYFTQTKCVENKTINEIYNNENVIIPSMFVKINKNRDIVKNKKALLYLKNTYHQFFDIKPDILKKINAQYNKIFENVREKKVLGCIYRGTDYKNIKPANHMIQPELDEFIATCREKMKVWNCEYIYVATEDEDGLEELKKVFKDKLLYTNQLRYKNTGDKFLAQLHNDRENDKFLRGVEYLEALVILGKCNYLVSGQNGALYGTLLLKEGEFEDVYIFDKGKYAATNKKYK